MFPFNRTLVSVVVCLMSAIVGSGGAGGQNEAPKKDAAAAEPSVWMKKKLEYSQHILAGIATGDFDTIAENAEAMQGLSKIEAFVRARTPGYRKQLDIFMEANAELIRQAQRDNVDGAALAFTQLTISCVQCHKQMREQMKKPGDTRSR